MSYYDFTPSANYPSIVDLIPRGESSKCTDAQRCETGNSTSNSTIIAAVVVPVMVIIIGLGSIMFYTHRRNKKEEELERDPDFDENGEATALPDLPTKFGYDNPFENDSSVRYPDMQDPATSKFSKHGSRQGPGRNNPYIDSIALPYSHQTESKHSLDLYSKNVVGGDFPAYTVASRRNSMTSSVNNATKDVTRELTEEKLFGIHGNASQNSMALKSRSHTRLQNEVDDNDSDDSLSDIEVRGNKNGNEKIRMTNPTNTSPRKSFNTQPQYSSLPSKNVPVTELEYPSSHSSASDKFSVEYENDTSSNTFTGHHEESDTFNNQQQILLDNEMNLNQNFENRRSIQEDQRMSFQNPPVQDHRISFQNSNQDNVNRMSFQNQDNHRMSYHQNEDNFQFVKLPEPNLNIPQPVHPQYEQQQQPQQQYQQHQQHQQHPQQYQQHPQQHQQYQQYQQPHQYNNNSLGVPVINQNGLPISPDFENFNQNNDFQPRKGEDDKVLTIEEQEELKRMKSVYKVYFDRGNSIHHKNRGANIDGEDDDGAPDLPDMNGMNLTSANTEYNKRLTTASSFYSEFEGLDENQKYYLQQQQFASQPYDEQQQYEEADYSQQQYGYQQYPGNQLELPPNVPPQQKQFLKPLKPLQSLPSPSDLRKSTIQTFTDFAPRQRPIAALSPKIQPFNPLESADQVWSPSTTNPSSFQSQNSAKAIPSASQLARSSVVMVNPVEIGKPRTFKPAGSIPSKSNMTNVLNNQLSPTNYNGGYQSPTNYNNGYTSPPAAQNYDDGMSNGHMMGGGNYGVN